MKFIKDRIVNWGIIGCGDVCEIKSGPAFNKIPNSKLVAVMRRDAEKAADFAKRHGVSKSYSDAKVLIDDPEINAIYIATPPAWHELYAIAAIQAGKAIYIEKPVALTVSSCQRLIEAAAFHQIPAVVAHYRRALPLFRKIKTLLQQNTLGKIRLVTIETLQSVQNTVVAQSEHQWRVVPELSGGGLFYDLAPHQLDVLYWIFGSPAAWQVRSVNQTHQHKAPDLTSLEGVFQNDIVFKGIWAFHVPEHASADRCIVLGDKGTLTFSFFKNASLGLIVNGVQETLEFENPVNIQLPMIGDTVKFFRGEAENPCSLEEAKVSMAMMEHNT